MSKTGRKTSFQPKVSFQRKINFQLATCVDNQWFVLRLAFCWKFRLLCGRYFRANDLLEEFSSNQYVWGLCLFVCLFECVYPFASHDIGLNVDLYVPQPLCPSVLRCVRQQRITLRGSVRRSGRPSITPVRKPRFSADLGHGEILYWI